VTEPGHAGILADVESDVLACFLDYERALSANDVDALDSWFAHDARVVRFGVADEQWGFKAVRRWRHAAAPVPPDRQLSGTRVAVWSSDVAVITTLFGYPGLQRHGRQSQMWFRTDAGWRIVAAHVSEV
jgi:ketosteroid isomerase-like protein